MGRRRTSRASRKAASSADRPAGRRSTSRRTRFVSKDRDLGQLELVAQAARHRMADRQARAVERRRPASTPTARGATSGRQQQTKLDVALDVEGCRRVPRAHSATPTRSRARRRRIDGQLAWAGAPTRVRLSDADAARSASTSGRGRFTKIEPGHRQAARRAVAAGAAAARHARLPATCSARASRSTRSPATCGSRTA